MRRINRPCTRKRSTRCPVLNADESDSEPWQKRSKGDLVADLTGAGRRQVLGVDLAEGESHASWRRFLESLRDRGLCGVVQIVSDDHSGLTKAIREVLPEAVRQRCCVHFLRNALDHLNRRSGDRCLLELRWIYERPSLEAARTDLAAWLSKWQESQPKLCNWVEETIEETFAFLRLPRQHHLRMRSTNMLERLNEEIKRRTKVVRIFPDARSCLRLVRALCAEIHERWMEGGCRSLCNGLRRRVRAVSCMRALPQIPDPDLSGCEPRAFRNQPLCLAVFSQSNSRST